MFLSQSRNYFFEKMFLSCQLAAEFLRLAVSVFLFIFSAFAIHCNALSYFVNLQKFNF